MSVTHSLQCLGIYNYVHLLCYFIYLKLFVGFVYNVAIIIFDSCEQVVIQQLKWL